RPLRTAGAFRRPGARAVANASADGLPWPGAALPAGRRRGYNPLTCITICDPSGGAHRPLQESGPMASLDVITDIANCFSGGWSDGLPVIPPYDSLVAPMLDAMGWARSEVVGGIPTQSLEIRSEHLAAAAVMAGCETSYGPVLRAVGDALMTPKFNIS